MQSTVHSSSPVTARRELNAPLAADVTEAIAALSPAVRPRTLMGAIAFVGIVAGVWFGFTDMSAEGRLALMVFGGAVVAWSIWNLPETPVALTACLSLIAFGAVTPEKFYSVLGDDLVWLMIASFIVAAALQISGLAERMASRALVGTKSVKRMFYRLTWIILATALVIPSTSGRAVLLLPLFLTLAASINDVRITRALALMFPSVILLSACASLLGAGAHVVAVDFIKSAGLPVLTFGQWVWLGAPFAIVSSFAATALILKLFLTPGERARSIELPPPNHAPLTFAQTNLALIVTTIVVLWMTGTLHGMDAALVALLGAVAATTAPITGVSIKQAIKKVEWNLILFLAATLVMGETLVHTGAAQAMAASAFAHLPAWVATQSWLLVLVAAVVALLSHLVITSRTARALVLVPAVALPLSAGALNPAALIFLTVVASGFCQTFTVSAKPVALFAKQDKPPFADGDLVRLSLALLPVMLALLALFAFVIWPLQGLPLTHRP